MAKIFYVVFETGSVLWNSDPWIMKTYAKVFRRVHEQYPFIKEPTIGELKGFCGPALDVNLKKMIGEHREIRKEAHTLYRKLHDTEEGLRAVELYEGVPFMLEELKGNGKRLFALTEKATEVAVASARHLGIADAFESIQGTVLAGEIVTRADMIRRLQDNQITENDYFIKPSNTIMVCGRVKSVRAASSLGFTVIGAAWGGKLPAN